MLRRPSFIWYSVHVNETSVHVTSASDIGFSYWAVETPDGLVARVPNRITVRIDDHPLGTITAEVVWRPSEGRAWVKSFTVEEREGEELEERPIRGLSLLDISREAVRQATGLARRVGDDEHEPVPGQISALLAERITRGPTRSQQMAEHERQRAAAIHRRVLAEEFDGDVYTEVARRMGVSRSSAYRYLLHAGVVQPRKNRRA